MSFDSASFMALSIFFSYFVVIIGLFVLILGSLPSNPMSPSHLKAIWAVKFLAIASFMHTWLHMFRFLYWSFCSYEAGLEISKETILRLPMLVRMSSWLIETSLFEQAWAAVCFGPFNWWWSQQLCLFTAGAWTVFLASKGRNHGVKHLWAYMLLGQLVAISVASNLFYLALLLSPVSQAKPSESRSQQFTSAPPSLYIPILLSMVSVIYAPYTSVPDGTFLINLLIMHILIFVPLVMPPAHGKLTNIGLRTLALLLSIISAALHVRASLTALTTVSMDGRDIFTLQTWNVFIGEVWKTLVAHHPAQSSIGWDVVWTSVSLGVWNILSGVDPKLPDAKPNSKILPFVTTSLFSAGGVAPLIFEESYVETGLKDRKVQ